jgi:hypothetical protein
MGLPGGDDGLRILLVDTLEQEIRVDLEPVGQSGGVALGVDPVGVAGREEEVDVGSSGGAQRAGRLVQRRHQVLRVVSHDEPIVRLVQCAELRDGQRQLGVRPPEDGPIAAAQQVHRRLQLQRGLAFATRGPDQLQGAARSVLTRLFQCCDQLGNAVPARDAVAERVAPGGHGAVEVAQDLARR